LYDIFQHYIEADREQRALRGYIWENSDCSDYRKMPSKKIFWKRYGLRPENINGLAWYLLEQYFKGNITIKEDVQSVK
jgi:hypothetical protein